jgi:hypothetical protein
MTCHRLLVYQSLIASLPLRAYKARSSYFALDCVAKNPVSFVVRPDLINLDWVRLALPRSPESGVAVSTAGKILSREKRKMWMRFSQSAHILWCVFHRQATIAARFRAGMCNKFLVTPLCETFYPLCRTIAIAKCAGKLSFAEFKLFQQLTDKFLSISGSQTLCLCKNLH